MAKTSSIEPSLSGILLHPSSLPNKDNVCGGFGEESKKWLQLLAENGIRVWQVLPLSPTDPSGSPYSSPSSFALNPCFLDVRDLIKDGFLAKTISEELGVLSKPFLESFDFNFADERTQKLGKALRKEWPNQNNSIFKQFNDWSSQQFWLEDHATFMELRRQNNNLPWWEWPREFADYRKKELAEFQTKFKSNLLEHSLIQWHLFRQWSSVRTAAKRFGISIFGDLPFYVARDSSDVWSNRSLFSILSNGNLYQQSGVPPDYFSATGQLWGNPVYRWGMHKKTNFRWWRNRFLRQWEQVDILRLDHFRALKAFWAIPGDASTAKDGYWLPSPGVKLLNLLRKDYGRQLPLIAEDLGVITEGVERLRDYFELPGMKILQFAFDGNRNNPYLPENINNYRSVVYTGTHDNSTSKGWWEAAANDVKEDILKRITHEYQLPSWNLIELGLSTDSYLFVTPLQDVLGLGEESRFNIPGTIENNWSWRLNDFDQNALELLKKYGELSRFFGRNL